MKKVKIIFKYLFLCVFVYVFISLFLRVTTNLALPMPNFYENWKDDYLDEKMKNDPLIKLEGSIDTLGKSYIRVTEERDSLQLMVDSLLKK